MRDSGSYDVRHCHGLAGIAGYVVVRVRPAPPSGGQYVRARERAAALNARPGEQAGACVRFGVDVVYTDGCRMPW